MNQPITMWTIVGIYAGWILGMLLVWIVAPWFIEKVVDPFIEWRRAYWEAHPTQRMIQKRQQEERERAMRQERWTRQRNDGEQNFNAEKLKQAGRL